MVIYTFMEKTIQNYSENKNIKNCSKYSTMLNWWTIGGSIETDKNY